MSEILDRGYIKHQSYKETKYSLMALKLLIYQDFQVHQGGQGTEQDVMSSIRKACRISHGPANSLCEIAELVLMLSLSLSFSVCLSLRRYSKLKSLANKENVYMFLVTWNKIIWQAIKCGRKSSPQQLVVILDNNSRICQRQ